MDDPYNADFLTILGADPLNQGIPGLGNRISKNSSGRFASEFIVFMENRMNFSLEAARPPAAPKMGIWGSTPVKLTGWHNKLSKHAAVKLDGSANYRMYDTRFVFGTGWTIWPEKPWQGKWRRFNNKAPNEQNAPK